MQRRFAQLDVFASEPMRGNPLAVVVDGDGLTDDDMARFANWTNLSETTFLLPPTDPSADYRVRIFTTTGELPFAGHPTIGSCRAWLDHGGVPATSGTVVQECGVGLVAIRSVGSRLAFAAPPLMRSGTVEATAIAEIEAAIGVDVIDAAWADNGPGWIAVEVADAATVRSIVPDFRALPDVKLGIVGRADADDHDVEVRAFFPGSGSHFEDPVTGSLNAAIAMWLMGRHPSLRSYVARQGTALGRDGRVHLERDDAGDIWVGGDTVGLVTGTLTL
ncbi:MAG: phenazine biosynthesis protein PhzF [Acidimicrobiaceae bacterium]|nr:phenazine biosynthesis protein PhzF [Acidimicrobiaceae bacterium]